jgi:hypothetical protein
MSENLRALTDRILGLEHALVGWSRTALAGAGLALEVGTEAAPIASGLLLRARRVDPEKPPDVGLDFGLMGVWGSRDAGGSGPVPAEWSAVGHAIRSRFEQLAAEQDESGEPVPPPVPLALDRLPDALRSWYAAQPPPSPDAGGWPGQPWLTDDGRARLPYLSWYPGFNLAVEYDLVLVGGPAVSPAAVFGVLATALRLEKSLPTALPETDVPPEVLALLSALGDGGAEPLAVAPQEPMRVALTLESPAPEDGGPGLRLGLRLPLLRGVSLRPASQLGWRTAPPQRSAPPFGRRGRDE